MGDQETSKKRKLSWAPDPQMVEDILCKLGTMEPPVLAISFKTFCWEFYQVVWQLHFFVAYIAGHIKHELGLDDALVDKRLRKEVTMRIKTFFTSVAEKFVSDTVVVSNDFYDNLWRHLSEGMARHIFDDSGIVNSDWVDTFYAANPGCSFTAHGVKFTVQINKAADPLQEEANHSKQIALCFKISVE